MPTTSSKRRFEATNQKTGHSTRPATNSDMKRIKNVVTVDAIDSELPELCIGSPFARGAHSKLHHGVYRDQQVAVKIIEKPNDDGGGSRAEAAKREMEFTREVTLLSRLEHPNVIKLAAACKKQDALLVITEYLPGGSLRELLRHGEPLSAPAAIVTALDIARAMEYVHSQGIIHRDLKPENVIFDQDFQVKVVDFGISCEQKEHAALSEITGTNRWMAPEVLKRKRYGRKVDVYSFGIVLWEMVTGAVPYPHMTDEQAAIAVRDKKLRPVIPPSCPAPLQALMKQCWDHVPWKRPEFRDIVKVLEQFVSAQARDGNIEQCQNLMRELKLGHRKLRLLHVFDKLISFHAW